MRNNKISGKNIKLVTMIISFFPSVGVRNYIDEVTVYRAFQRPSRLFFLWQTYQLHVLRNQVIGYGHQQQQMLLDGAWPTVAVGFRYNASKTAIYGRDLAWPGPFT